MVYLTVSTRTNSNNLSSRSPQVTSLIQSFQSQELMTRSLPLDAIKPDDWLFHDDILVLSVPVSVLYSESEFSPYVAALKMTKVKRAILVLDGAMNETLENYLKLQLDQYATNGFFFVAYVKESSSTNTSAVSASMTTPTGTGNVSMPEPVKLPITLKKVISLNNVTRAIMSDLKFNQFGHIDEEYNLEGLVITSLTLSWDPYFIIDNCDEAGKNCDQRGFLADFMDGLCKILNCTWDSHAPPDGNWGVRPISGPFNKSGVWGGAMGGVVNGEYMTSLSQWVWNVERYHAPFLI